MRSDLVFKLGEASRHASMRVFDWDKAAQLIKERQPKEAGAGLSGDWEWTGGCIYRNGEPVTEEYTYLASTWAVPELNLDGELIDCWQYETDTKFNEHTKWPKSALKILEAAAPRNITESQKARSAAGTDVKGEL